MEKVKIGEIKESLIEIKKSRKMGKAFFVIVIALVVVAGLFVAYRNVQAPKSATPAVSKSLFGNDTFSALFIDNNDVYFGKITKRDSNFITLENSFYLRVTQVSQKGKDGKSIDVPSLNLVKVGTELHKPKDKVEIQISHILSIQELDPASDVITAIKNYKEPTPGATQ